MWKLGPHMCVSKIPEMDPLSKATSQLPATIQSQTQNLFFDLITNSYASSPSFIVSQVKFQNCNFANDRCTCQIIFGNSMNYFTKRKLNLVSNSSAQQTEMACSDARNEHALLISVRKGRPVAAGGDKTERMRWVTRRLQNRRHHRSLQNNKPQRQQS